MAGSYYYFAWANSDEIYFNSSHMREDDLIFSFALKHDEGQFAELELEIINPRVGLLAPGRLLWAWFAWNDGSQVHPLFFGRLVAIPDDIFSEIIKIKLLARPLDYVAQRESVANSLKVLPYFDPLFIAENKLDDPDTALEGYSALWHVDRTTLEVTVSDIISGEEGLIEFTQADAFYDKLSMKVAGAPLLVCEITTEVGWTQCDHTGIFEMKSVPNLGQGTLTTGTPGGVQYGGTTWPPNEKPQAPKDETQTTYSWTYKNVSPGPHADGDLMEESGSATVPYYGGDLTKQDKVVQYPDKETGQGEEYSIKESYVYTYQYQPPTPDAPPKTPSAPPQSPPNAAANTTGQVAVEVQQDRKEGMYVAMRADVQPVLASLVADEKNLLVALNLSARDPVEIGLIDHSSGAYFATARGQQSVEYLLMVARAHLLAGSRVVEVEWECPFNRVINMSCRMNAAIDDPRLPGGQAIGKIVSYAMSGTGEKGEFIGKVKIHCSVGNGVTPILRAGERSVDSAGRIVVVEGTPVYVDLGYVDDYQFYEGRMVAIATNDASFSPVEFQAIGIQLPISEDQVLVRHEYHDGMASGEVYQTVQAVGQTLRDFSMPPIGKMIGVPPPELIQYSRLEQQANQIIAQVIQDNPSWVEMEFKPTKGVEANAAYATDVSQLAIPAQISLS